MESYAHIVKWMEEGDLHTDWSIAKLYRRVNPDADNDTEQRVRLYMGRISRKFPPEGDGTVKLLDTDVPGWSRERWMQALFPSLKQAVNIFKRDLVKERLELFGVSDVVASLQVSRQTVSKIIKEHHLKKRQKPKYLTLEDRIYVLEALEQVSYEFTTLQYVADNWAENKLETNDAKEEFIQRLYYAFTQSERRGFLKRSHQKHCRQDLWPVSGIKDVIMFLLILENCIIDESGLWDAARLTNHIPARYRGVILKTGEAWLKFKLKTAPIKDGKWYGLNLLDLVPRSK